MPNNTYRSSFSLSVPTEAMFETSTQYDPFIRNAISSYLTKDIDNETTDNIPAGTIVELKETNKMGVVDPVTYDFNNSNAFTIHCTTASSTINVDFPISWSISSTTNSIVVYSSNSDWCLLKRDPNEIIKDFIKNRSLPTILVSNRKLETPMDIREIRARETLKLLLGDDEYRKFLKNGFVSIKNRISDMVYQIYPGHKFTNVYKDGKKIERLCVVLDGNFPPTDSLIVRYLMILNDEEKLWQLANKHGAFDNNIYEVNSPKTIEANRRSLVEIYNDLKVAA